jgi:mono/diheme cytochrome c family protein
MPEHANLTEAEFGDLVAYVQSLSREPKWHLRTYEMRRYAARGLYRAELGNARKAER